MQYIDFRDNLKDFTVFSISDIKKLDSSFQRRRLNEWQDKGYIKKIVKGYYIFSELKINEDILFEIANRIYAPSYISFETALAYYGLIPESVYGVTSVSTRRTYIFKTSLAEFIYKAVKPALFFGYDIIKYNGKSFKMATPEKAILDYFYNKPSIKNKDDFESLRINKEVFFKLINNKKLRGFLETAGQKSLARRIKSFSEFIKHA